jgi:hypothetical protein
MTDGHAVAERPEMMEARSCLGSRLRLPHVPFPFQCLSVTGVLSRYRFPVQSPQGKRYIQGSE